jgi:hypothetical protein
MTLIPTRQATNGSVPVEEAPPPLPKMIPVGDALAPAASLKTAETGMDVPTAGS